MTRFALRRACLLVLAHHALALVAPPRRPRRATSLALSDYVPTPVDPAVVAQQLGVIGASGGAAYYWWTVTVPQKRLEVSRSKKGGDIAELLDELETAGEAADGRLTAGDKRLERWLLSDWLDPQRRKDPALPFLPKSKFNSGDNPIIAAAALILAFGVANALGERAFDVAQRV